jgi:hypothetical protein
MRKFYIIDFSAGNFVTHHLNYAITYFRFIQNLGHECQIFLPKYLRQSEELNSLPIKRILLSGNYKMLAGNFLAWRMYHKLVNFLGKIGSKFDKFLDKVITKIYVYKSFKEIANNLDTRTEVEIIFPSVDLMSILILEKMLLAQVPVSKYYLRINAVDKNMSSSKLDLDGLSILDRLIEKYPNISIGCETKNLLDWLVTRNYLYKESTWIPLPSIVRKNHKQNSNVFGFLGGAKKRKGFQEIPKWIEKISKEIPDSIFLVQQSPFCWPGYKETIQLLSSNPKIKLLPEFLSNSELFDQIASCAFIVTPYDSQSYHLVGSSLFYYAADLLVPTISYSNLGFSEDILKFSCGIIVPDLSKGPEFNRNDIGKFRKSLIDYNSFRNKQNSDFLKIFS